MLQVYVWQCVRLYVYASTLVRDQITFAVCVYNKKSTSSLSKSTILPLSPPAAPPPPPPQCFSNFVFFYLSTGVSMGGSMCFSMSTPLLPLRGCALGQGFEPPEIPHLESLS